MSGESGQYGFGSSDRVLAKWYTAKDINATNGSRVAVQYDLAPGDIVTEDPFDNEGNGIGQTVGSVLNGSTFLGCRHYIVKAVHPDVNRLVDGSTTQRRGGAIQVVERSEGVLAYTKANMTAGVTALVVTQSAGVTAKPYLAAGTDTSTAALAARTVARAQETVDTSTTAAYKKVAFGGVAASAA